MVINLAPVSLSNKKVNFYTCPRLTFLKKNATENAYKSISEPLDFRIFWLGECAPTPPPPLAPSAFGAWNLPLLFLKPGYGPATIQELSQIARHVGSKSCSLDPFPSTLFIWRSAYFCLFYGINNLTLETGHFPWSLCCPVTTPQGAFNLSWIITEFRPIFQVVSKIIEKVVASPLINNTLELNNLSEPLQSP